MYPEFLPIRREIRDGADQTDENPTYEPPAVADVAEFSELTTGCGFDFFEMPAQPKRPHERTTPFAYKPLLVRAMRQAVPAEVLGRSTKGEYSAETQTGPRLRRADLAELLDQPLLATLGLVDADALRHACLSMFPPRLSPVTLEATLAVETWLRAHAGPSTSTTALGSEAAA